MLAELEPMIGGGLVTLEQVEVVVYRAGPGRRHGADRRPVASHAPTNATRLSEPPLPAG